MSPAPIDEAVRIAVVGTGLAGLTAAYLLQTTTYTDGLGIKKRIEVHLFEKAHELGMDASSLTVKTECGSVRVDAPMRSINRGSHSRVNKLYEKVGVKLRRLDFGYAFTRLAERAGEDERDAPPAYDQPPPLGTQPQRRRMSPASVSQTTQFIYEGQSGLKWPPLGIPRHLHPTRQAPSPLPFLANIGQLLLLALSYTYLIALSYFYVSSGLTDVVPRTGRWPTLVRRMGGKRIGDKSVRSWARRHWVWGTMVDEVLVPLWAAVCTVDKKTAEEMPVGELLQYLVATFGTEHYVARDGVRSIVSALSAAVPLAQIHLDSTLQSLEASASPAGTPRVVLHSESPDAAPLTFDHVILATQANQARALLSTWKGPASALAPSRLTALDQFSYLRSLVVTHSDSALLPKDEADHRDLTFASHARDDWPQEEEADEDEELARPKGWIQATHLISTKPLIMQTTNPCYAPSEDLTYRSTWFERAVVTQASRKALPGFLLPDDEDAVKAGKKGGELQGVDHVWLVGSWAAEGCPLLEGCVSSAERVVRELVRREGWTELGA